MIHERHSVKAIAEEGVGLISMKGQVLSETLKSLSISAVRNLLLRAQGKMQVRS